MLQSFRGAVVEARRHGDLFFASLLSEERIHHAVGDARVFWRGWIYTPAVTVWVFLSQCLSPDHSCREAVARLIAWRVAGGQKACSPRTGAYCTARADLPEDGCQQLVRQTGRRVEAEAPVAWLWHGRSVRVLDGSTITMADTPANQAEYPQEHSQAPGCGFPIARILVVFSLSVGTVLDAAISRYQGKLTGENSMFRTLHGLLAAGDVVLADRYFSGWFDIALLWQRGVDCLVRKHQLRATDFRTGRRLGKDDHLVRWRKPQRPPCMSSEQYASLPAELELREVRIRVVQKGFRTKSLVVVTTLTDAAEYPAEDIAALYRQRWQAELCLRSLKSVLQMDHLRCQRPERVRNEFRMHLVGYNLIRHVMAVAAFESGVSPWEVSFKGALQTINNLLPVLATPRSTDTWCTVLLEAVASHVVGNRPDRIEPRCIKRRPKHYKKLREPRANYKRRMAS
jgi:putative transposase